MNPRALTLLPFILAGCATVQHKPAKPPLTVEWPVASTEQLGGYTARPTGEPKLVNDASSPALCFDGTKDSLEVFINPLDLQIAFTVEVLMKPDADGGGKQQFLHLEDANEEARVLMETRRTQDGRWHFHSFVRSHAGQEQLSSTGSLHDPNQWYWAAVTYADGWLRSYVDGKEEQSVPFQYKAMQGGKMSLGSRLTHESWFKGCIAQVRFANAALPVDQLQHIAPQAVAHQ